MLHPRRILILPFAAIVIAALCAWRIYTPRPSATSAASTTTRVPAPSFQLYDQESRLVQLQAFLHRHTIVLAFFDGQKGPEADPALVQLRQFYPALKRERIIVLGVSTALPQEIRNSSSQPFPFPLLSDVAATDRSSVHRVWGRIIEPATLDQPAGTEPGVFVIDRTGLVAWEDGFPMPENSPETIASRLLNP
ncbi:MAG: redoxin domain-containing protein [Fuerstiella sp.]